jgi:hypothetical protein
MVQHKRIKLNDFVAMNNNIHMIWQSRKQDVLRVDFVGGNTNKGGLFLKTKKGYHC